MKLRKWQKEAQATLSALISQAVSSALVAACPGAGKTLFTAHTLKDPLLNNGADRFVIVVPSRALKRQWKRALKLVNLRAQIDVSNQMLEETLARGGELFDPARPIHIYTYAQIANYADLFAVMCARHKVYAVFDEIHHADDNAAYGRALVDAFTDAVFKLSLSGTPFNTKAGSLAFCNTREAIDAESGKRFRETICDFVYGYGDALAATGSEDDPEVVRPVTFLGVSGRVWREYVNMETGARSTKSFTGGNKSESVTPLLDPELPPLNTMLRSAVTKLDDIRKEHSNAGMLITAIDGDHAKQISELLSNMGVNDQVTVLFDTPKAHDAIIAFEKSNDRVLIAVKMVSEGVDIKRLRVGVYASNVLTFLFFMQFIGRFIRWDSALPVGQNAYVFIPQHKQLMDYAERIERMQNMAFMKEATGGDAPGEPTKTLIDKGGEGEMGAAIERGRRIDTDMRSELDALANDLGVILPYEALQKIYDRIGGVKSEQPGDVGGEDIEHTLSRQNDRLVAKIKTVAEQKGLRGYDYARINAMANSAAGIPAKNSLTPEPALAARLEYLKRVLMSLYAGEAETDAA